MAVISKDDLMKKVSAFISEEQNDDAISLVEDISDTLSDYEAKINDTTNWKQKYEENDKAWRQKYVSRFSAGVVPEDDVPQDDDEPEPPKRFEDLFSVKE